MDSPGRAFTKDYLHNKKQIRYVVTNPRPETVLWESDLVFILSQCDPNDQNSEFYKTDKQVNFVKSSTNTPNPNVNKWNNDLNFGTKIRQDIQESQQSLIKKIETLSTKIEDLHKKLNYQNTHLIQNISQVVEQTIQQVVGNLENFDRKIDEEISEVDSESSKSND